MMELLVESPVAFAIAVGVLGLIIGSFLNVVILRLPPLLERQWLDDARSTLGIEEAAATAADAPPGLVVERSRCPQCGTQIRAYDNVPVLSYLWLRGRCRTCHKRISLQYPFVELLTGVASALVAWRFGLSPQTLAALLLTWTLIALSGIDLHTQLLPDSITLPLLWAGLLLSVFAIFATPAAAILGAAIGYLTLWTVFWAFWLVTGKEGMGFGDFKLLGALGAWLGWSAIFPIILLSTVVGAVVGTVLLIVQGRGRQQPMPFGPFLAAAGYAYLVFAEPLRALLPIFAM
jgi:leader peptidase (prepilin peptidase)/N-methyltransferase